MNNIGVILAGGIGERFDNNIPKQFVKLNGKYVISYIIEEFIKSKLFNKILVVLPDNKYENKLKKYNVDCVIGGKTRSQSVYNAIMFSKKFNPDAILFHEAARPLIKSEDLSQYIEALKDYDCSITSNKITDALYHDDRDKFLLLQAPEAYRFKNLIDEYDVNMNTVSIYQQIYPCKIKFITLNHPNYKITYPYDLYMIEHLIKYDSYISKIPNLKDKNITLLGSSGGIGSSVLKLIQRKCKYIYNPTSSQLDLNEGFATFADTDVIINCAGISYRDDEGLLEKYDTIMNINLKVNLQIIEASKKLKHRPINIVFISSSSVTKGRPNLTVYSASKAALQSIVESQAEELSKQQIYINCICPERVNTPLAKKLHNDLNKDELLESEEVATAILSYCDTTEYGKIIYLRKGMKI